MSTISFKLPNYGSDPWTYRVETDKLMEALESFAKLNIEVVNVITE